MGVNNTTGNSFRSDASTQPLASQNALVYPMDTMQPYGVSLAQKEGAVHPVSFDANNTPFGLGNHPSCIGGGFRLAIVRRRG